MKLSIIFLALVVLFRPDDCLAQWVNIAPEIRVTGLAVTDSIVFASTENCGVYRSTNGGLDWTPVNRGLTSIHVNCIGAQGTVLYAGTIDGVFRTTNLGDSWIPANDGMRGREIFTVGFSGTDVIAGTDYIGPLRSVSQGRTWFSIGDTSMNMNRMDVSCVAAFGNVIILGSCALPRGNGHSGIWITKDNAITWSTAKPVSMIWALTVRDSVIIAAVDEDGLWGSADTGRTWQRKDSTRLRSRVTCLSVASDSARSILAGTLDGHVYRSIDDGEQWEDVGTTHLGRWVTSVAMLKDGTVLAAMYDAGVFRCDPRIGRLVESNAGLKYVDVSHVVVSTLRQWSGIQNVYIGTNGTGLFGSVNRGDTWKSKSGFSSNEVTALAAEPQALYTAVADSGLYFSGVNDFTWTIINQGLPEKNVGALVVLPAGSNHAGAVLAGTRSHGVVRSANHGGSWDAVPVGSFPVEASSIAVLKNTLFLGLRSLTGDSISIHLSTDGGDSWTQQYADAPATGSIRGFAADWPVVTAITGSGGYLISSDSGRTWVQSVPSVTGRTFLSLDAYRWNFYVGTDSGIYVISRYGGVWVPINDGLPAKRISALGVEDEFLYVGTEQGVWRRPLLQVTGADTPAQPSVVVVEQNYPDPVTSYTTIPVRLARREFLSLKIYDALGRTVATLASEERPAGPSLFRWNAAGLPAGTYFYRFQAGAFSETRKLLLLK